MIEITIVETTPEGDRSVTRFSRNVDHLDIEAAIAAVSAVIAKQGPARKRRRDAGVLRGGAA